MPRRPRYYPRVEDDDFDWMPYVSVDERREEAERRAAKLRGSLPVIIKGSRIANTFWGKSWCENLERYSDYANRLPRGRTYVRSGCVIDLKIAKGLVTALVSGTRVYDVEVRIAPIPQKRWKELTQEVAGAIDSLVELVKGEFSKSAMETLCRQKTGLFPEPAEIRFQCSCPDSARMCKHIAAVLYGIGARLDENPELLFLLRNVDQQDLITKAGTRIAKPKSARILEGQNLSEMFGIEIVERVSKRKGRKRERA
ncbi:MAG TPA: SWIM zinc finger family protein [Terriglobia bacterium]|nr:SWIM zinc finger family protein [Terriglobia bacterium]